MRALYTVVFYLCLPLVVARLLWRARLAPAYAQRWSERFGFCPARTDSRPAIWVHAVSVGESLAAMAMIRELQTRYPSHQLMVTTTTPTGSERVLESLGDSVFHVYAPYDLPDCLNRFLRRTRPEIAIIMETELWPNTIAACHKHQVAVVVANARLSEKSAKGYQRLSAMARPMLEKLSVVAAQHQDDGERFIALGLPRSSLQVTGNIKFDLTVTDNDRQRSMTFRQRWQSAHERPVLLAASTHQGEDELLLAALSLMQKQQPDILLVLVPRHPERFESVFQLASENFVTQKHSDVQPLTAGVKVLIGNTMGEMMPLLGASDLVFMGGTWVDNGGHNFIEPAAWSKPMFSGSSLFNFAEVSRLLIEAGGLEVVETPEQLAASALRVLGDPAQMTQMGQSAKRVADDNRGALQRLLGAIDTQLKSQPS
ncbi:MAG: lipid IV(A) 3-deoxy-D-manno-octulosonic acid transferase [Cellvibrionaceae bacterium]